MLLCIRFLLNEVHRPKTTLSESFNNIEILKVHARRILAVEAAWIRHILYLDRLLLKVIRLFEVAHRIVLGLL